MLNLFDDEEEEEKPTPPPKRPQLVETIRPTDPAEALRDVVERYKETHFSEPSSRPNEHRLYMQEQQTRLFTAIDSCLPPSRAMQRDVILYRDRSTGNLFVTDLDPQFGDNPDAMNNQTSCPLARLPLLKYHTTLAYSHWLAVSWAFANETCIPETVSEAARARALQCLDKTANLSADLLEPFKAEMEYWIALYQAPRDIGPYGLPVVPDSKWIHRGTSLAHSTDVLFRRQTTGEEQYIQLTQLKIVEARDLPPIQPSRQRVQAALLLEPVVEVEGEDGKSHTLGSWASPLVVYKVCDASEARAYKEILDYIDTDDRDDKQKKASARQVAKVPRGTTWRNTASAPSS